MYNLSHIILSLTLLIVLTGCNDQMNDSKNAMPPPEAEKVTPTAMDKSKEQVILQLEELGYFKYVTANEYDTIVAQTFENYKNDGVIHFPYEGLNRTFGMDAEFIYEAEGILDQIKGMLPLFSAMGIDLTIGQYVEEFENNTAAYTKRTIELNGITYDASGSYSWGSAFHSGVRLINEILKNHQKDERVYGLFLDETSTLIILSEPQYEYLTELIPEAATYRLMEL